MLSTDFWKKYFTVYDLLNELIPYQELLDLICNELTIAKSDLILDAGAGTGNLGVKLEEKGARVVGFDSSPEGLEIHKLKTPNAELIVGDLAKPLPFPSNYFDKVSSNNTIYALPKQNRLNIFKEFHRVLKPGGKIAVSNVIVGFSPLEIYKDHISTVSKLNGKLSTMIKAIKLLVPTIKIFHYNRLIKKEHRGGNYDFFETDEQKNLLRQAGFLQISENINVYSKQGILNSAVK